MNLKTIAIILFSAGLLGACAKDNPDTYVARDVEVIYNIGLQNLERGSYGLAAVYFDEVERQHPYSPWARRAMLMSAFGYYKEHDYDEAILAAERFLTLHPGNSSAPYAHYIIAISYYSQITDVGRDQEVTQRAMDALEIVVSRYPDTDYARDALLKIDMTRDHLAGKELDVGRFYQNESQYLASVIRFRSVLENYQTTSHVPEALHRLVESYLALGLRQEARQVAAVLGYNYPDSRWYTYSYNLLTGQEIKPLEPTNADEGWLSKIF